MRVVDPLVKEKTLPTLAGNWREFLSGGDDKEVDALRMATRTGRPAGDEVFITVLSKIMGKNVMRGTRQAGEAAEETEMKNGIMSPDLSPDLSEETEMKNDIMSPDLSPRNI